MHAWILALFLGWAQAQPPMATYPPQKISTRGIRAIVIRGVNGHLRLRGTGRRNYMTLAVRHSENRASNDWYLSVDRRGRTLYLEVFNVTMGSEWRRQVREDQVPEFDIDLEGPARPVTAAWREGRLEFQNWNSQLDISFLKGHAIVKGGRGPLNLQAVDSQVSVLDHQGSVKIKGDRGRLKLAGLNGDVRLNWVKGNFQIQNVSGRLRLDAREGRLQMIGDRGHGVIHLAQGQGEIRQASGHLKLVGQSSKWTVQAEAAADVDVVSESGPVRVRWNRGGVKAFLASSRGRIEVPKKWWKKGPRRPRAVSGESLRKALGQLFVRTQSGAIALSQGFP